jgi:hypothetical protein
MTREGEGRLEKNKKSERVSLKKISKSVQYTHLI